MRRCRNSRGWTERIDVAREIFVLGRPRQRPMGWDAYSGRPMRPRHMFYYSEFWASKSTIALQTIITPASGRGQLGGFKVSLIFNIVRR
jgi:hypothetical protein